MESAYHTSGFVAGYHVPLSFVPSMRLGEGVNNRDRFGPIAVCLALEPSRFVQSAATR
jgi:hypothetical protein